MKNFSPPGLRLGKSKFRVNKQFLFVYLIFHKGKQKFEFKKLEISKGKNVGSDVNEAGLVKVLYSKG